MKALARGRLAAEVWLWRHGWGWALLAVLGLACALVWACAVLPQRALRAELALRTVAAVAARTPVRQPLAADSQWAAWQGLRAALPDEAQADRLIARTLVLAREQGLSIDQADFQYQPEAAMQWVRLSMTVPVRGAYPATRRFIESVLREHPQVALDEITIKRDSAGASAAEAVSRWSAWFRTSAAAPRVGKSP